ncbi:hypothetical protein ADZ37_13060 [Pannonibacter phragmitetus]|nr:hypothetical protein ADZ37_13060 [Pannonibacter phragmitetus]
MIFLFQVLEEIITKFHANLTSCYTTKTIFPFWYAIGRVVFLKEMMQKFVATMENLCENNLKDFNPKILNI